MLARSYGQAFATRLHKAVVLLPLVDNINIQRRFGCTCQSRHAAGKKLIHCNFTGEDDANSKGTPLSEVATHDDDLLSLYGHKRSQMGLRWSQNRGLSHY